MRRESVLRAAAVLMLAAAVAASPSEARKGKAPKTVPLSTLPGWVGEAFDLEVPDHGRDLVWLVDETDVEPSPAGGVTVEVRQAVRVLRSSALDDVSGMFGVGYSQGDEIEALRAWTIGPDRAARPNDPKDDVADLPQVSAKGYNDLRIRIVYPQGLAVGSVVAFEARFTRSLDAGAYGFVFGVADRAVGRARLTLRLPDGWSWDSVVLRGDSLEKETTDGRVSFTAGPLAPIKAEPLDPPFRDRAPIVWLRWWNPAGDRGYRTWDDVAAWFHETAEPVLANAGEAAALAVGFRPADAAAWPGAIENAFEFAARRVRYVAIDVGLGIGAGMLPAAPADVCSNGYGDCKDKAFLLRALIQPWGEKTYPVLVRVRDAGEVTPDVPTPGQFNHCIAAVRVPEGLDDVPWSTLDVDGIGRVLFLDATARDGDAWDLRRDVQGTLALLVDGEHGHLVRLPVQPPEAQVTTTRFEGAAGEDATLGEATLSETATGNGAARLRWYYARLDAREHEEQAARDLAGRCPGAEVVRYEAAGIDDPAADFAEQWRLRGGRVGKRVADLLILEPGTISPGVFSVSLPDDERRFPLELDVPRTGDLEVTLDVPDGWVPEELPAPVEIDTDDARIVASWTMSPDGELIYRRRVVLRTLTVPVDRYADFRETLSAAFGADRAAVVFVQGPAAR